MPGFNQTGPMGQGPKTGRRMGRCTNFNAQLKDQTVFGNENPDKDLNDNQPGIGFSRGRGRKNRFRGGN